MEFASFMVLWLCFYFIHIIILQKFNDETIPIDLPMSQRMLNRGYTSASINQSVLKDMDLSFFPPPPRGVGVEETENGTTNGDEKENVEERNPESRGRSSRTSKTKLPSIVPSSGRSSMNSSRIDGSVDSRLSLTRGGTARKVSLTVVE